MKALVLRELGGPDKLAIEDIPTPEPAAGQVRVKIKTAALNRRDVWITVGAYPRIQFPAIAGSDGAGVVDAVGAGVDAGLVGREVIIYPALEWGDDPRCGGANFRVLGMPDQGTFAEYICVPADSVVDKPAQLSWEEAAALPLAGLTAWRAIVTHGEVARGHKVLVTGIGGGCATFALAWGLAHGAEVYVTSSSADKIAEAVKLGATAGFDYRDAGWVKQLKAAAGAIDIVIDSAGGEGLHDVLDTLGNGGRYVFFGATRGNAEKGLNMAKLFFRQVRIQGTTMGRPEEFRAMVACVNAHKLKPVVDHVYPFAEAVAAHKRMQDSEQMGKLVLRIA
ncbi:MAG: zinc-binding dehydrogenase [Proteobacteria bacterium]|nr:zinc-binding dehydrogenase [Pseudomonadota bacterium]